MNSELIDSMSRTLFVEAYANEAEERDDLETATMGEDWFNVAPDTPSIAYAYAGHLLAQIEQASNCKCYTLLALAKKAYKGG